MSVKTSSFSEWLGTQKIKCFHVFKNTSLSILKRIKQERFSKKEKPALNPDPKFNSCEKCPNRNFNFKMKLRFRQIDEYMDFWVKKSENREKLWKYGQSKKTSLTTINFISEKLRRNNSDAS